MTAPAPGQKQQQQAQPQTTKVNKMEFQTIYPQYLDSTLTPCLGRRVTANQGVPKPTLEEIFYALRAMGYNPVYCEPTKSLPCAQSQAYCIPPPRGCIKVPIKELAATAAADGNRERKVINPQFANKSQVLKEIGARIKAIPDRKVQEMTLEQKQAMEMAEGLAAHLAKESAKKPGAAGGLGALLGAGGPPKPKMKIVRR